MYSSLKRSAGIALFFMAAAALAACNGGEFTAPPSGAGSTASPATAAPSAAPQSTLAAAPNSLALDPASPVPGSTPTATFTVMEAGDTAAFNAAISCTPNPAVVTPPASNAFVATISPATATPASAGAAVTFTITTGAETGACTATITDAKANAITVPVAVSTTALSIFGKK